MNISIPKLSILSGAIIFGTSGVFVKLLDLPVTVFAGFRLLVPCLILFIFCAGLRKALLTRFNGPMLLASSITVLRILLWVMGLKWAPITKAVVVLFSWPVIFYVLSLIFGKDTLSPNKVLVLLTAVIGMFLVNSGQSWSLSSQESLGLLCMFGSAILFASNMFIFKGALAGCSPMEVVLRDCLVGSFVFLPFVIMYAPHYSSLQVAGGLGYGVIIGLLAYFLIYYGLARVQASTAAALSYAEVASASMFGLILFGERVTLLEWFGAGLILVAAIGSRDRR